VKRSFNRKYRTEIGMIPKDGSEIGLNDLCDFIYESLVDPQSHQQYRGCAM